MTNEEAAKILREIAQTNLPTVNGLPFPEIKKALMLGADALAPISDTNPEKLKKSIDKMQDVLEHGKWNKKRKTEELDDESKEALAESHLLDEKDKYIQGRWRE